MVKFTSGRRSLLLYKTKGQGKTPPFIITSVPLTATAANKESGAAEQCGHEQLEVGRQGEAAVNEGSEEESIIIDIRTTWANCCDEWQVRHRNRSQKPHLSLMTSHIDMKCNGNAWLMFHW